MGLPRSLVITRLLLLIILFVSPVGAAAADGKVFAREGVVATIPDQRALIHFADGVQTLVIETRFESSSSPAGGQETNSESGGDPGGNRGVVGEFAWVVPVPSVPELIEVTPGLMPTVQAVFEPRVLSGEFGLGVAVSAVAIFVACYILLCMRSGFGARLLAAFLFLLMGVFFLLPSLGRSRGIEAGESTGVALHDRRILGHLDVAVLSATSSESLASWLTGHGFVVPPETAPAIDGYVRDGWSFCAARLNPASEPDVADAIRALPHPLGMRFETGAPIYPLRLTATATDSLEVDLYVLGPSRAAAPGFKATRCSRIKVEDVAEGNGWRDPGHTDGLLRVSHSGLRAITDNALVGTKLSATLTPAQMSNDAAITWEPYASTGDAVYSRRGALDRALFVGAVVLAVGSVLSLGIAAVARLYPGACSKLLGGVLASAMVAGTVTLLVTQSVPTFQREGPGAWFAHHEIQLTYMGHWQEEWMAGDGHGQLPTLETARAKLRVICNQYASGREESAPREEDSPGNYTLRETAYGIEYVWYDARGGERSQPLVFPIQASMRTTEPDRTPTPSGP
ncbi:MAG: DUF2330 domain-containing protein [Phycisphaeraceae bacterium]|nr:DUF2330 domain-containing protein [Phycisphaeraceae bacterium]